MDEPNDLLDSVLSILSGRVLTLLVGIAFTPIFVRLVTKSEYGVFATVMAAFVVVETVAKGGLFDSITKHVADYRSGSDEQREVVGVGVTLAVVYGTIASGGLFVLVAVPQVGIDRYAPYLVVLGSVLVANNVLTTARAAFYGRRREQVAESFAVARQFLQSAVGLVMIGLGFGLFGFFLGYAGAILVVAVVAAYLTYTSFGFHVRRPWGLTDDRAKSIVSFGGMQLVGGVSALLLLQTDVLLVNYFTTSTQTASYQAALKSAEFVWFVAGAIQGALLQNATSHLRDGNVDAIDENVEKAFKYSFLTLSLFGVGLFVLADEFLVAYYGSDFDTSTRALRILVGGTFLFGLSRVFYPVLKSAGYIRYTESITVAVLVVNVVLNVLFIPRYGIEGAAVATGISYVLMFVCAVVLWLRTEFELPDARTVGSLVVTFGVFLVSFVLLTRTVRVGLFGTLFLNALLGGVVFAALCLSLGVVDRAEVRSLLPL